MKDLLFMQLLLVSVTTGLIILLIKLLSSKLNRTYAAKWKYWLWLVLAVRLLVPWSPSLPVQPIEIAVVDSGLLTEDVKPEGIQQDDMEDVFLSNSTVPEAGDSETSPVGNTILPSSVTMPETLFPDTATPGTFSMADLLHAAEILWLAGAVLYLGYFLVSNRILQRRILRWSEKADADFREHLQSLAGEPEVFQKLQVFVNSQVNSPMIMGLLSTKLILPKKEYTEEELSFVLRHELTHYKRRDLWYKVLLLAVNAVHWFNPLVYLMCKEADSDLECCCDSMVMENVAATERRYYANMILNTVAERGIGRHILTSSFHGGKEELKKRLINILDSGKKRKGILLFVILAGAAFLVGGLVHFNSKEEKQGDSSQEEESQSHISQEEEYQWYTYGADIFTISEAESGLNNVAVWMEYEEAAAKGEVVKYVGAHDLDKDTGVIGEGGCLPGLGEGDWYCVTVDGVEYIYVKYDQREEYELLAYAVVGEEVVLGNGLQIGKSREQVKELCPGILDAGLEEEEGKDFIWTSGAYPGCWDDNYDYMMVLEIDDGIEENPGVFLALMMQEDKVCAMTPFAPVTDRLVLPLKPGEVKDAYAERGFEPTNKNLPEAGISVYERYPTPPDTALEILLTDGELEITFEADTWSYEVYQISAEYLLFAKLADQGTGISVYEPHIIQIGSMTEAENMMESPFTFMEEHFEQSTSGETTYLKLLNQEAAISVWKDSNTGEIYDTLTWNYSVEYLVENGQLICRLGLCEGLFVYRAQVEIPYLFEDGKYVIDKDNVKLLIDEQMNNLAQDSLQETYILQKEGLDIDGNGVKEDTLSLRREMQGYEGYNLLTVELDGERSASLKLPSNNTYVNDNAALEIIPDLQMQGRNSIVVILQDPTSNYGSADYYVMHVEKDAARDSIMLETDLVILDGNSVQSGFEHFEEVLLEVPFACLTYYNMPLSYYHEELGRNTIRINGLREGDMQETAASVYWEEDGWEILTY